MTAPKLPAITLHRMFAAPREKVFRAFTDPVSIPRWFVEEGSSAEVVELNLRDGGTYVLRGTFPGGTWEIRGVYREVKIPERLVFTWRETMSGRPPSSESVVSVSFREAGAGNEVTLTHPEDELEAERRGHEKGWEGCFDRLAQVVA
jgi:uncharacterized protein YndB with AHSA1/START domain